MSRVFKIIVLLLAGCLGWMGCKEKEPRIYREYSKEELLEVNRKKVVSESELIDAYIQHRGWDMEETSTGMRYQIYYKDNGPSPTATMVATITYDAYLLDGTRVETTSISGPISFRIEHDDVISGLHEAVLLLSVGDSGRFIIPSHLAHGLTGDSHIPSNASLLYEISLVDME